MAVRNVSTSFRIVLGRLYDLVAGVENILFSEAIEVEGALVFAKACEMGLEGIVSKRAGSLYRSGNGRQWLKCKNPAFVRGRARVEQRAYGNAVAILSERCRNNRVD